MTSMDRKTLLRRGAVIPLVAAVPGALAWLERAPGAAAASEVTQATAGSATAKAVAAANAFLRTLSSSQRSAVQLSFDLSVMKAGWSNLPVGAVARKGMAIKDMSSTQLAALNALLKVALGPTGYTQQLGIRKADTYLAEQQSGGGGGGGGLGYGEGLYYIALYGTPSTSSKWTLQFGGHHLARHITFSGATVSNTPYFAGVEPSTAFTLDGKTYAPMAAKAGALYGAVQALDSSQLASAKLSQAFDDVLVGPQKDGTFPTRQGVAVSSLSAAQRALVTKAIKSYVADMPATKVVALMRTYTSQYAQTKLAWSTSTDSQTTGAYVRLHGPRLWLEIIVQNGVVLKGVHYHSIMRDITSDYGAGT